MSYDYAQLPASLATHDAIVETLSRNEDAEGLQALGLWVRVLMAACTDDQPKSVAALAMIGNVRRSTAERIAELAVDTGLATRDGDRYRFLHVEEAFLGVKARRAREAERKRLERSAAKKTNDSYSEEALSAGHARTSFGQERTSAPVTSTSGHRIEEKRIEENRREEDSSSLRSELCLVPPELDTPKPRKPRKADARKAMAERLFAYWQKEYGRPKTVISKSEIKHAVDRITELEAAYDPEDPSTDPELVLQAAIVGIQFSENHNGSTGSPRYMEFFHVCKNQRNVNMFYALGAEELQRREREARQPKPPKMPIAATEHARQATEAPKRYQRSGEQLEAFYEARRGPVVQTVEKLEKYLERYPDDDGARIELELAKNPVIIPDADRFEGLL